MDGEKRRLCGVWLTSNDWSFFQLGLDWRSRCTCLDMVATPRLLLLSHRCILPADPYRRTRGDLCAAGKVPCLGALRRVFAVEASSYQGFPSWDMARAAGCEIQ